MPFLHISTNISIENKVHFAQDASRVVASMLGKPESYVMVRVDDEAALIFDSSDEGAAHLQLKSLGLDEAMTDDYSTHLCAFIHNTLEISALRIYIEFSNPERHLWGWNNGTF